MGFKCAPDFLQHIILEVLRRLDGVEVHLDNICIYGTTWEEMLFLHDKVCSQLKANGFNVTPLKCEWAVKGTDWHGYLLTLIGIKP